MAIVHIGNQELSRDEALAVLRSYAMRHRGTVLLYDLAGDEDGRPGPGGAAEPLDQITLADIGRLVVINAGLRADDVPPLLEVQASQAFAAVPPAACLEECTPGSPLYLAATCLYDLFRLPGVGGVKRSKLLHIKRPSLVPIYDSHVHRVYEDRAVDLGIEIQDPAGGWWEAARRDLVDGSADFAWLSARLRDDEHPLVRRTGKLTGLRLLDIIAWQLGSDGC